MATPVNVNRWKAEYAKSSRSSCKTCKNTIDKEKLRLGKMGQATQFDGYMPMWNHASCILKKANQIICLDDVEGIDSLRWEDQQKIRKYIETGVSSSSTAGGYVDECVEVSQTSRATCKLCNQRIMKGEVRISTKSEGQGARGLAWHHTSCFMKSSPSTQVEKLSGWESLSPSDQEVVRSSVREGVSTTKSFSNLGARVDNSCIGGTKRKSTTSGGPKSKLPKPEESISVDDEPTGEGTNAPDLESRLEAQSKRLWAIKDELKKHVTTAELREMLKANHQYSSGSEFDLRDHCADGMLFGALGPCPMCKGPLCYSGGQYRCRGFFSEWNKCSYMTTEASRLKRKWKIPADTSNEYLNKWFKSQKGEKPVRLLPPSSFKNASGSRNSNDMSNMKSENLEDLKVAITGLPKKSMEDWKCKIESVGGTVHAKIKKDTTCLVISGSAVDDQDPEIRKARRMKLPIVRDGYLGDCIERKKMLQFDPYKVEAVSDTPIRMVTVNVKGRSVVHESSGLQDSGHILEDGKSIYNTTLSMSDLTTGVNSYYILQIIKDDKGSDCSVFRKWGRVGNDKIGGTKLEEMSKSDAIVEFKRLFLQNTGNYWESWVQKKNFQKQPGKFFPLDIDYGENIATNAMGLLAPPLIELMKMLSDKETYRAAMMEFEINMSEMPLGMLSKSNIQKGFEVLTVIQNLLASDRDPSIRENMLKEASSHFFTLIPSIHPHIIRDEDDFKSKVKMLDALQDIEIASRLVDFDVGSDDSLDENYKKLRCDITPLPHDSEDFQLVKNYLHTTHAPTHTAWNLELEDVFALEREGELDQFTPYRNKLQNKMLLWHGSQLTNFVSILSQGLRIPLPEAPATGYMFGKGVYFADMVSKSAQYCRTDKENPVGLMLLSEVALGQMHELKKATCMDKPPKGKHSTKGLGKTIPQPSEYVKWRDEVVVPCGKPVPSNVKSSELLYNEFVIYDTAQIKMQFLLKVRFHHKIEREDKQGPPALVPYPPKRGRRGASYRRFGEPSR